MPMGLVNSPAVWQRTADVVLQGLIVQVYHMYMDGVIMYIATFEGHVRDIEKVLRRLRAAGLKLKSKKCQFLKHKVKSFCHTVCDEGIRPDSEKVESVITFPRVKNLREVREDLGFIGYCRRHVDQFSKLAKPLTALTLKNAKFEWTEKVETAF